MRVRPVSRDALIEEHAGRLAAQQPGGWLRVALDGAPAAALARRTAADVLWTLPALRRRGGADNVH